MNVLLENVLVVNKDHLDLILKVCVYGRMVNLRLKEKCSAKKSMISRLLPPLRPFNWN